MAITAKELRQKAQEKALRQKAILDSATETLTDEQEKEFDALHDEEQKLIRQAKKIEEAEKREIEESESEEVETPNKKKELTDDELRSRENLALKSYLMTGAVPQELRSFMPVGRDDEKNDQSFLNKELEKLGIKATQTTTTTGGGYTIPRGFMAELEKALLEYGGMWEAARIIRTRKGNTMDWPTTNDTTNKAYLLSESTSAATSAQTVVFGQQQFEAYKYTSGLIQIPTELIEDSEFDITSEIRSMLVERIWRGTNEAFTTADGSSKPRGVIASGASVLGYSTAADGTFTADELVELIHSVDPAYRKMPGTRFMFHDSVLKFIKKLSHSSSDDRPLWLPSIRDNEPGTIYGYPYTINQDFPTFIGAETAADDNKKIVAFGDFKKYIIRLVRDMRIVRLNERYGELDQVAFVVFIRVDGDLLNAGTNPIKYLRVSTT